MPIPLPNLDDRRWADLVDDGVAQIPRYAPKWTDHNIHDPGIMLMELIAWIADAQIYSLARLRRDERLAYARLLGLRPRGPQPARGLLWPPVSGERDAPSPRAWPDGTVGARYAFGHALYQRVLYYRVPAGRRRLLHQRIGGRLEAGFGTRAADVAAELAVHFERGGDAARAIKWLESAAISAERRFAQREPIGTELVHCTRVSVSTMRSHAASHVGRRSRTANAPAARPAR